MGRDREEERGRRKVIGRGRVKKGEGGRKRA